MARIKKNAVLEGVSGMIGKNIVVKQTPRGGVMANRPKGRRKNSPLQEEQVSRFQLGIQYSRERRKHPGMEALYATGITKNKFSAHHVAVSDYLHAPKIHEIDAKDYHGNPGDLIRVRATDDFKVNTVKVIVTHADGTVIESGDALMRGKKGLWRMAATVKLPDVQGIVIRAEVTDVAGNATKGTMSMATGALCILPDPYAVQREKLSGPVVTYAAPPSHSDTVKRDASAIISPPVERVYKKEHQDSIIAQLRAAFPGIKVDVVDPVTSNDQVVTKGHLRIWLEP